MTNVSEYLINEVSDSNIPTDIFEERKTKNIKEKSLKPEIPWYQKYSLSIIEAAAYAGIGKNKMYSLVHEHSTAPWIFMNGTEHRIKRKLFEEFLDEATAV